MTTLYAVQHCQSEQHVNGMVGGAADWPLTPLGLRQAHQLGRSLARELDGQKILLCASDLKRAQQTAEVIGQYLQAPVATRPKLRETDLGRANGQSRQWLEEHQTPRQPGAPRLSWRPMPDAESDEELYLRVGALVQALEREPAGTVVAVGHGGSLRMLAAYFLQIPLPVLEHFAFKGSAGGVSIMEKQPDNLRVLKKWNDTGYIAGA